MYPKTDEKMGTKGRRKDGSNEGERERESERRNKLLGSEKLRA